MDNHETTCLILLDLSATFDMVDHEILIKHLHNRFGIGDTALKWIESYLKNRSQKITICDLGTDLGVTLTFGVSQGSILGPILFTLYQAPLESI